MKLKKLLNEILSEQISNLNNNFKKWFGGSKMGTVSNPTIFYHGTNAEITKFLDIKKGTATDSGMRGRGFYFTTNERTANAYGRNVYKVYLKITNPIDLFSFESIQSLAEHLDVDPEILVEDRQGTPGHSIKVYDSYSGVFAGAVREKGYDGVIHKQEFVCFEPTQIKSVDNDGTWDLNDDNIFS